jgi:hypothetical protein
VVGSLQCRSSPYRVAERGGRFAPIRTSGRRATSSAASRGRLARSTYLDLQILAFAPAERIQIVWEQTPWFWCASRRPDLHSGVAPLGQRLPGISMRCWWCLLVRSVPFFFADDGAYGVEPEAGLLGEATQRRA